MIDKIIEIDAAMKGYHHAVEYFTERLSLTDKYPEFIFSKWIPKDKIVVSTDPDTKHQTVILPEYE